MLKYLVGCYDPRHPEAPAFGEPFFIIRAKDRECALERYDSILGKRNGEFMVPGQTHMGKVMGLVTLLGPMNLDPQCSLEVAKKAMKTATEVDD
jgi:hypothetical protein